MDLTPELDTMSALSDLARHEPTNPAVVDASGRVSYAELDKWSNDLANRINAAAGDKPRVCLVVSGFDRQGIVGMIASLKTPHILVALDSEIPPANIAEIARQLDAGLCVYSGSGADTVRAANLSIPTLAVGDLPDGPVPAPPPLPDLGRTAVFKRSSGSTGGAKTAAYSAEAILIDARLGAWVTDIAPGAGYALVSTFDSAMSAAAILRCLLAGGTLMPVDLRSETPRRAVERLVADGLTHIHATPTAFRLLTQGLARGAHFPAVHSVFLSGEKSTQADVRLIAKTTPPDCRLRAAFSSSETQLVAHTTVYPAQAPGPEDFAELTLFPGVHIDILSEDGHPMPPGELGRVRVTSKMIALGYRGEVDPAAAARFTANDDGTRSFLTDDMGYLNASGALVLTSRAGREVKIRGRRVDLGALEAWLTRQEDIAEAAVVAQPLGDDGSLRLVAFIKADTGFQSAAALRERMRAELIAPMQPTAVVLRDDLPRTPNQKIDRKVLEADMSHLDTDTGETFQARGVLGDVAKIWATVLNRPVGPPESNFFDLGGDSISATIAALALEESLGFPVDTGFVYRHPVLFEQARALEKIAQGGGALPDPLLVPLTRPSTREAHNGRTPSRAFMIPGAYGFVLPFAPLARALAPDWDLVGILHPDLLTSEPKLYSVEETADRMCRAMKAIQPEGPYFVIGYSFGGAVGHEICRRLSEAGEPAANVILDTRVPALMTIPGKMNLARRDFVRWLNTTLDRPQTHPDDLVPFRDMAVPFPGTDEDDPLPFSFARASRILSKYRPGKSKAPTILVKATQVRSRLDSADFGWSRVARLEKIVPTPGRHRDFFQEPNLEPFVKVVGDSLRDLETRIE